MRRVLTALLLAAVAAAGAGAAALARKTPPHRPAQPGHRHPPQPKPAHRHKHKPAKKPGKKPATQPAKKPAPVTTPTTPTTPADDTPPASTTPADTPPPTATTPAAPLSHALGVTASDAPSGGFVLSMSRTLLGVGPELIAFRNISQDGHDLRIDAADGTQQAAWDELASLATPVARTVTLSAGTYRVYCTLHLGMERQLTVQ